MAPNAKRIIPPSLTRWLLSRACAVSCVVWLTGCSIDLQPALLVDRIKNRGPIGVSSTNPFLAANKYLEYQKRTNHQFKQFVSTRGAPAAIEIQKPLFESSAVYLYYPENGEYFIVSHGEDWSVRGPFKLTGRKMDQVKGVIQGIAPR